MRLWLPPGGLLVVSVSVLAGSYLRGGIADATAQVPVSVEAGILTQVLHPPGERPRARAAVILPHALEDIWAVLTDYDHYGDICPYMHGTDVEHAGDGRCQVTAHGETLLGGQVAFELRVRPEQELRRYVLAWEDTGGPVVNRGQWILTPAGEGRTLLELEQEIQVGAWPSFAVRAITRQRLRESLGLLRQRLSNGPTGRSW
jgi:hypothetical protein